MARVTRRTKQAASVVAERPQQPQGWSLALTQPAVTKALPPGFTRSVGGVVYCIAHGLSWDACHAAAGLDRP